MRLRCVALVFAVFAAAVTSPGRASAASGALVVSYSAGWNMIAGTPGTSLSTLGTLYAYGPSGYVTASNVTAQSCAGYWAQLGQPVTVTLAPSPNASPPAVFGTSVTCSLRQGWTLVGNPFSGVAMLPPGTEGWWWNPATGAYELALSIKPGGAVWLYSTAATSINLYYAPADTLVISRSPGGQYVLHVGQHLALAAAGTGNTVATSDLDLEAAITAGTSAQPFQLWLWHADAVGTATLVVQLPCEHAKPPCLIPDFIIEIQVVA